MAYFCLHKLHKWPHEFLNLEIQEQAYVIAAVELKIKADKEAAKKARKKGKR